MFAGFEPATFRSFLRRSDSQASQDRPLYKYADTDTFERHQLLDMNIVYLFLSQMHSKRINECIQLIHI